MVKNKQLKKSSVFKVVAIIILVFADSDVNGCRPTHILIQALQAQSIASHQELYY